LVGPSTLKISAREASRQRRIRIQGLLISKLLRCQTRIVNPATYVIYRYDLVEKDNSFI
jgi:hypothetical protein